MERKKTMRGNLTSHPVENRSSKTTNCPGAQPFPTRDSAQKLLLTMMELTMMTQKIKCKETRAITRTVMWNCKDRSWKY